MKSDFSQMPAVLAKLRKAVDKGVDAACRELVAETKRALSRGAGPKTFAHAAPGTPPFNKTGNLSRRVGQIPSQLGRGRVVSRAPYSRILELGGIIRPKKVKRLPVPLNWEAQRMLQKLGAGGSLRAYSEKGKDGKDNPQALHYIKRVGRDPLLVRLIGKGKRQTMKPMFILKRLVRIKPHPFLAPSLAKAKPRMVAELKGAVRTIMGGYR